MTKYVSIQRKRGFSVNDLLKLAIESHAQRWERIPRFPAAARISGAICALQGKRGLLESVVLAGDTRNRRLTISSLPWPGRRTTWQPYRQTMQSTAGVLAAGREPVPPPGAPGLAAS